METQIYTYLNTNQGPKLVTIFAYATRGVPGIEINGCGKFSKNIREKMIYLTRARNMKLPTKRFVISIELNDINFDISSTQLKSIEFPILLLFWYLAGFIPIKKLDDCVAAGHVNSMGEIFQSPAPKSLGQLIKQRVNPVRFKSMKYIYSGECLEQELYTINSQKLLEHIPNLEFKQDYIERLSATPLKSSIA